MLLFQSPAKESSVEAVSPKAGEKRAHPDAAALASNSAANGGEKEQKADKQEVCVREKITTCRLFSVFFMHPVGVNTC